MSTMLIQSGTLDDIADAIRSKTGKVASMTPLEMPDEIESISGGGGQSYTIEQGQTTSTSTATASLTEGKYYLFNTVYGDSTFSGAKIMVGDTKPIFTATGIGRTGCIIKATSNTVTYSRSGNVSANEYTEIDVIPDADIGGMGDSWNSGTAINSAKDDLYFLTLGDGETGNIVGADILVEHELVDTVSNGTRFLIVKAIGSSITLDNSHSFYYRQIGIIGSGGSGGASQFSASRKIEGYWDGTGSTTYTFDADIDNCLIVLTYTRENDLTDTRYTLTLASGSYSVLYDSGVKHGMTTYERTVILKVDGIKIGDTLYMYNYGDFRIADVISYT